VHRKGSLNIVADSLSRVNEDTVAALDLREGWLVDLSSEHFKSAGYIDLVEKVAANQASFPDLKTDSGYVYRKDDHLTGEQVHDEYAWKLWIPRELVPEILSRAHDSPLSSHCGIHKTIERVRRYYFWPGLLSDIKTYINAGEMCKSTKAPNFVLRTPLGKAPKSQ